MIETIAIPPEARCRSCGYRLVGLAEPRCPECGVAFDPSDPGTYLIGSFCRISAMWRRYRRRVIRVCVAAACIGLSWGLYLYGFSFLFWAPLVILLVRRQWIAFLLLLALNPLTALLAIECREYANGGAMYVRPASAVVWTPQGSDHPETRLRGFDPGCGTRSENYWIRSAARRWAGKLMHVALGPPPGAYTGPYPTLEQCLALLDTQGQRQPETVWNDGIIRIGNATFTLDRYDVHYHGFVVRVPDRAPVTAALIQPNCLIVRIPRDSEPALATIRLFDTASGRCFAMYWDPPDAFQ